MRFRAASIDGFMVENEQYHNIPPTTIDGLLNWVEYGNYPGGFLTAVLENDLFNAFGRGDLSNQRELVNIVALVYNHVPQNAWGSVEKMEEWNKHEGFTKFEASAG